MKAADLSTFLKFGDTENHKYVCRLTKGGHRTMPPKYGGV